jgi:bifunctional enzyme CysN/CysC
MRNPAETAAADAAPMGAGGRSPLRLLICGARGSGKSTLAGGLFGGPQAAQPQGLAVDTGYRYAAAARRAFLVADISGDAKGTRDLAAAASHAQLAILLVDAGEGLTGQTRRQALIASLMGVRHLVLAVNKIDLVGFDRAGFDEICESSRTFVRELNFTQIACVPVCARERDNLSVRSARTPWYAGPPLLDVLEAVDVTDDRLDKPLRMAVQSAGAAGTGFTGRLLSGRLNDGDKIAVLPAGQAATVKALRNAEGETEGAQAGDTVTVTLVEPIDVKPGDVLAAFRNRPQVADQFAAHLIWLSDHGLLPERSYRMQINGNTLAATVTNLKHRIDVDSLAKLAAKTLGPNEIGVANLSVAQPVTFDAYADNRAAGGFLLLDRDSGDTVAIGMVDFALRRATNVHYQSITVSKAERSAAMPHRPAVLWFTGLSGAGKSTIANLVEASLHARGAHTILLDGDNIRHGLNRDLGFTEADRVENIRRIGEVAKLMTDAGLIVLCSFISPFRAERRMVRELLADGEFVEIFVDTPLKECIARDPKGLYARALAGEIKNFTGVDQAYEMPENAEIRLEAGHGDPQDSAQAVIDELARRKIL